MKYILVFLVIFLSVAANLPEDFLNDLGFSPRYFIAALGAWVDANPDQVMAQFALAQALLDAAAEVAGAHLIDLQSGGQFRLTCRADRIDLGGLGQEGAHDALAALRVEAEIMEGIGMTPLDDGIGFSGQFAHSGA